MTSKDIKRIENLLNRIAKRSPSQNVFLNLDYCIDISEKEFDFLEPFLFGFKDTKYKIQELEVTAESRICDCTIFKDNLGTIKLCFKNQSHFYSEFKGLFDFFNWLVPLTRGVSLTSVMRQARGSKSGGVS